MTSTTTSPKRIDPVEYVRKLELPKKTSRRLHTVRVKEGEPQGYVNAGSLTSFVSEVSGQARYDVLNSTLLAQLAANFKYSRERQPIAWYNQYVEVLQNVGWVTQRFSFDEYTGGGSSFTVQKAFFDVMIALLSEDARVVAQATIKAVSNLAGSDDRVKLFENESHNAHGGAFQISAATEEKGAVSLAMGAFYFSTSKTVTNLLWFRFEASHASFHQDHDAMTLNDQVYSRVRQQIVDKLGDRAEQYVANIQLG